MSTPPESDTPSRPTPCRFGYVEYDATQYCHEHSGFRDLHCQTRLCDRAAPPLPLHRTEAGYPICSTCDGGGCPDCTDPA